MKIKFCLIQVDSSLVPFGDRTAVHRAPGQLQPQRESPAEEAAAAGAWTTEGHRGCARLWGAGGLRIR